MSEHLHWRDDSPEERAAYQCVEVAPTVCLEPLGRFGEPDDAPPSGYFFRHDVPGDPERCVGSVRVWRPEGESGPTWGSTGSLADGTLTLTPSIRCVTHDPGPDAHGFVTDGKWRSV